MVDKSSSWHLAQTDMEVQITEFELQIWRLFNGFLRWAEECERMVNNTGLDGFDLSVLHIVRMKERPKSIADIGRLLNRTDNFNLQYSIKKLLKKGLVRKIEQTPNYSKSTMYEITPEGVKNTETFTTARRKILIDQYIRHADLSLSEVTKTILKLKSIYDEAEQAATLHLTLEESSTKDSKNDRKK